MGTAQLKNRAMLLQVIHLNKLNLKLILLFAVAIFISRLITLPSTSAWLLAQTGLNESYRVRHLSMYFSRVFLCISVESQRFPTLIEAQWPETYLPMRSGIFPHISMHANGNHSDCELIQAARWSQVDSLNRLWVMDMGWKEKGDVDDDAANSERVICPPKLLVFDLIRNNVEVLRIDCSQYIDSDDSKLLAIKLGPKPTPCKVEKFIYFILADNPHILAYDILEQKWQRRKLISKKYNNVMQTFPIQPIDIAFGGHSMQHELLISDADGSLYSSPNTFLTRESSNNSIHRSSSRNATTDDLTVRGMEMKLLGSLLGPSKGMMVDHLGALFYVVTKFGAVVRCEYKQHLTAENNEIIYLTSKNIQQIFFGNDGSVWLLTDRVLKPHDHCFNIVP